MSPDSRLPASPRTPADELSLLHWNGNAFAAAAGPSLSAATSGIHVDKVQVAIYGGLLGGVWLNKALWPNVTFDFLRLTDRKLDVKTPTLAEQLEDLRGHAGLGYLVCAPLGRSLRPGGRRNHSADEHRYDKWVLESLRALIEALPCWRVLFLVPGRSSAVPAGSSQGQRQWAEQVVTYKGRAAGEVLGKVRLHRSGFQPGFKATTEIATDVMREHLFERLVFSDLAAEALDSDIRRALPSDPVLHHTGRVHRHFCRGGPVCDPRQDRRDADAASQAGMRDPALLAGTWPELWEVMRPISDLIARERLDNPNFQGLRRAFGAEPSMKYPPRPTWQICVGRWRPWWG